VNGYENYLLIAGEGPAINNLRYPAGNNSLCVLCGFAVNKNSFFKHLTRTSRNQKGFGASGLLTGKPIRGKKTPD